MRGALILGGSGFVGGHLALRLAARAPVLATSTTGAGRPLAGVEWARWTIGDDLDELVAARQPEWVIFAVAVRNDQRAYAPADREAHIRAAAAAARYCAESGATMVFMSSGSVFDAGGGPSSEGRAPNARSEYGRCKAESEAAIAASGAAALIVRFCQAIGRDLRWPTRFERLAAALARGERVDRRGDFRTNNSEVRDVCEATDLLLGARATGIWHLGSVDPEPEADYARRIARAVGADPSLVIERRDGPLVDCALEVAKARAALPARLFPGQDELIARALECPPLP